MKCKSPNLYAKNHTAGGFTFIEVIIALAIASIALLALIRLHLISARAVESARMLSQAAMLADQKMAEVLSTGYPERSGRTGVVETGTGQLHWATNVVEVKPRQLNGAEVGDLRKVSVQIDWSGGVDDKCLELVTYVANRKLP